MEGGLVFVSVRWGLKLPALTWTAAGSRRWTARPRGRTRNPGAPASSAFADKLCSRR